MPYCTLDDLKQIISEAELIQLTDDERLGTISETRVTSIGTDVDDLIDGFLRGRYSLPLDPVPQIITSIAKEMRVYKLFLRKKRQTITREMTDNYNAQIKLLEKIQRGEITLGEKPSASGGGVEASGGSGEGDYRTNKTAEDREFGKDTLKKW